MKPLVALGLLVLVGVGAWSVSPPRSLLQRVPTASARTDSSRVTLHLNGMTCGSCAKTAELALQSTDGVYRAQVSYDSATALVTYDSTKTTPGRFIARLKELTGYEATVVRQPALRRPGT